MSDSENILIRQIHDFHKEFREMTSTQLRRLEDGQKSLLEKIETLAKVSDVNALELRITALEEFKWKIVGIVTACQVFLTGIILLLEKIVLN